MSREAPEMSFRPPISQRSVRTSCRTIPRRRIRRYSTTIRFRLASRFWIRLQRSASTRTFRARARPTLRTRLATTVEFPPIPEFAGPAGFGRTQVFTTHYLRFGYDYTINATMLNHFNARLQRTNSKNIGAGVTEGEGTDWDQKLGFTGLSGRMFPADSGRSRDIQTSEIT